jgi:hypothetical protein
MRVFSKQELKSNIYPELMMLIAFSIPLHNSLTTLSIMLLILFWIAESSLHTKQKRKAQPKGSRFVLGFSLIDVIYIIGAFYSKGFLSNPSTLMYTSD